MSSERAAPERAAPARRPISPGESNLGGYQATPAWQPSLPRAYSPRSGTGKSHKRERSASPWRPDSPGRQGSSERAAPDRAAPARRPTSPGDSNPSGHQAIPAWQPQLPRAYSPGRGRSVSPRRAAPVRRPTSPGDSNPSGHQAIPAWQPQLPRAYSPGRGRSNSPRRASSPRRQRSPERLAPEKAARERRPASPRETVSGGHQVSWEGPQSYWPDPPVHRPQSHGPALPTYQPQLPRSGYPYTPRYPVPREWADSGVRRETSNRKPRQPRNFSGSEEVWEDYKKHYHGVAMWNRWDDADKASGLYLALTGHAADYIYSKPASEDCSYQELSTLLETRFGADRCLALDKKKLRERTRQPDETYASMGQDILRLARRVYKGAPDLADREGKDYFLRALPSQLRVAVAAANPSTVNECIDHVNRLCVVLDPEDEGNLPKQVRWVGNKPPAQNNSSGNNNPSGNKPPGKGKRNRGGPKSNKNGDKPSGLCWDCGDPGHMRNKCPEHFKFKPKQAPDGAASAAQETKVSQVGNAEGSQ